jgi:RsiW-degrading membrane proteinase PrsW (M82 family)
MKLLLLALAPVFIIAIYIYRRDKFEREPIKLLLLALLLGSLSPIPVVYVEKFLTHLHQGTNGETINTYNAFYNAFVVAAFTEELFKFLILFLLIWNNKNFNEKFDGIVYAVFISLGFAAIENIMYVFNYGQQTGYVRALVSVPGHALFGVTMGFYFGLAKFYPKQRKSLLLKAFFFPVILHGIFDFILMLNDARVMVLFLPFVIYLYFDGFRKLKNLSDRSIFRKNKSNN